MATYTIVDENKSPLGPGEINAGTTIQVSAGDVFIIDPSADANIVFEAASGSSTDFEVQIDDSNSSNFSLEFKDDLNPEITVADDVDIGDVDIKAKDAESVEFTAGNNVTLGKYEGSDIGSDTLIIGDNFTTTETIKTEDGDDSITIGDGASLEDIETGDGDDSISIGDGATLRDIKSGKGDDAITIGDDLSARDIKTGDGADNVTIGDGATIDDLNAGKGDDTVTFGDDLVADKIETKDGDDVVTIGSGATVDKLDGGKGQDTLISETDLPDAQNFENVICFAFGTMIRTENSEMPVEELVPGTMIATLDHGLQPLRWIGRTTVSGRGSLAPVRIAAGVCGNQRTLWVSQQHRMLLGGWYTQLLLGIPEALVAAKHLVDGTAVRLVDCAEVTYFHLLFDQHEIVFSEGAASESYHPGAVGLRGMSAATRNEILALFPDLQQDRAAFGPAARAVLKAHEGRLLADLMHCV